METGKSAERLDAPTAVERLLAVQEIEQLARRYAYAVDTRDLELLMSLWAETAENAERPDMNIGTVRAEWRRWFDKGPTVHFVTNHVIDVLNADQATGSVYCLAQLDLLTHFVDRSLLYRDAYVRMGGRWLFAKRRHLVWFGQRRPENPIDQPPEGWPGGFGRGSLPASVMTWQQRNFLRR